MRLCKFMVIALATLPRGVSSAEGSESGNAMREREKGESRHAEREGKRRRRDKREEKERVKTRIL